ncbi:penicilin amidase [Rhodobacteraceae bacterium HIMB11]|nr:penicilin amidase [Rhodobacteraceae bacterium HIMB11]
MAGVFRILLRIAIGSIALVVFAIVVAYYLAARSLPDYDAELELPGALGKIEVVRDTANVPHIFADQDADVFFGLGYVHAQDRLWQMSMMRRTAQGRLSEIFGPDTVHIDTYMRHLDLYSTAVRSLSAQSPETLAALNAYSRGVNARLHEINTYARGRGAPEMFLFNAPFATWQPADSLVMLKLMSVTLSSHMTREIRRAKVSLALPDPERIVDILPDHPATATIALPDYASLWDTPMFETALVDASPDHPLAPWKSIEHAGASNAFAAAPARSAAGGTILANDPHLELTAPTIWYLARMELSDGGVIGATIPGIPLILSGRNEKLAWGMTSSYLDDQDILMEEVNADNPTEYRTEAGWTKFRTRQSIINVADGTPKTLTLRWSDNGPILPVDMFSLASVTPRGHVPALSFSALSSADTTMTAAFNMIKAENVTDAIAALEGYIAPSQNVTFIDRDSLGFKVIGAMPKRSINHQTQGRMPALGWVRDNQWDGRLPYSDNPKVINPETGIIGNTNNKTTDADFPNHVSFEWGDSQRINRLKRLMEMRKVHTRESLIEAQLDTVSFTAQSLLPLIGKELWFTGEAGERGTLAWQRTTALSLLADWNGEMNEHLPEPLIYSAWLRAIQTRLIRDELGPLAEEFTHVEPLFIERVYRDIAGASVWCDVIQSAPVETCEQIASRALDDALVWLSDNFNRDPNALRWGDAHQATHDHAVLGKIPVLHYFANIRQSTSGGDNTLLRGRIRGGDVDPFHNVHAAGYRSVVDFADPDSSVFVTSTGQSGHFLSRHYDDLGQLWRLGEYVPMSLDPRLARAAATGITTITPLND